MAFLTVVLFAAAVAGLTLVAIQSFSLRRHLTEVPPVPRQMPPMSILKPLCGADDELEENLACFATLDYPSYELLLGVASTTDAAYPVACAAARRWPDRVRVVVQRGEPGMNPKINQLVTLQAAAQYDLLVVSDSNVRVEPGYLHEIAALFEDPEVGLVTHAMVGAGAESLGSWLEALYLDTVVSAAVIAAQRVLGKSYVVGKSLAMRKADLVAMGGFYAFKDLLAEDFAMGRAVESVLGLRVAHGKRPVRNVTVRRSAEQTFGRFERWSVMQRQAAGTPTYFCQILLHPTVLALLGFVLWPTPWTAAAAAALGLAKLLLDASTVEALGEEELSWRALAALPLKDLFAAGCFAMGLVKDTVDWRGHQLRVLPGTRIERPADEAGESRAPSAA